MATRSIIAMQQLNGIKAVYCHWDGYPSYNGSLLFDHYTENSKIEELLSMGNISSLSKNINPPMGKEQTFCKSEDEVCVFYARDRNEKKVHYNFKDRKQLKIASDDMGVEFVYLYNGQNWYVYDVYSKKGFKALNQSIIANDCL